MTEVRDAWHIVSTRPPRTPTWWRTSWGQCRTLSSRRSSRRPSISRHLAPALGSVLTKVRTSNGQKFGLNIFDMHNIFVYFVNINFATIKCSNFCPDPVFLCLAATLNNNVVHVSGTLSGADSWCKTPLQAKIGRSTITWQLPQTQPSWKICSQQSKTSFWGNSWIKQDSKTQNAAASKGSLNQNRNKIHFFIFLLVDLGEWWRLGI